ncbi:MAG: glutathione binding-like protein [Proteobacteria bacterium]|nr:glutathione binding-like protein [Pseudomonadota bacterium]
MPDLRIFSYLPNPRLAKALIAARYSGAEIEIVGASPRELVHWLWDYDARALSEGERAQHADCARQARTGFSGTLYKTDAFLAANPFGDVPTAFGAGGERGLFESNSIMRAAARLGSNAPQLYGADALEQSRIDGFLDRTLVFAREVQRYLLSGRREMPPSLYTEMADALESYLHGVEQALQSHKFLAGDALTLADIAFACELCLFTNEVHLADALERAGLAPLLPSVASYPRACAHLADLAAREPFSEQLSSYLERLPPAD